MHLIRIQDPRIREIVEAARSISQSSVETAVGILIILLDELSNQTKDVSLGSESLELLKRCRPSYRRAVNGGFQMRAGLKSVAEDDYTEVETLLASVVHQLEDQGISLNVSDGLIGSVRNLLEVRK